MKLISLRKQLKEKFIKAGIELTDADFVVAECLGVKRTDLIFVDEVNTKQLKKINKCVKLRLNNMPVDNIFKQAYFCGNKFKVNKYVLTPRQDSEVVVENAIKLINKNNLNSVLDLCTGSGCLAITIAKQTNAMVSASDVSSKALKIAKLNASANGVKIKFVKSSMFNKIKDKFDLIISNPPYIETDTLKMLDKEVQKYDPTLALDGGEDGLDYYREISNNVDKFLNNNGYIVLEIGYNQKQAVKEIFNNFNYIACLKDFGGNDRVMIFKK